MRPASLSARRLSSSPRCSRSAGGKKLFRTEGIVATRFYSRRVHLCSFLFLGKIALFAAAAPRRWCWVGCRSLRSAQVLASSAIYNLVSARSSQCRAETLTTCGRRCLRRVDTPAAFCCRACNFVRGRFHLLTEVPGTAAAAAAADCALRPRGSAPSPCAAYQRINGRRRRCDRYRCLPSELVLPNGFFFFATVYCCW